MVKRNELQGCLGGAASDLVKLGMKGFVSKGNEPVGKAELRLNEDTSRT